MEKEIKEVLKLCEEYDRLVIYGAGATANVFYLYLKQNHLEEKVVGFAVSKMLNNPEKKYGIKVCELKEIEHVNNLFIVVATQKINHVPIEKKLKDEGYNNYAVINEQELLDNFYLKLYEYPIERNMIFFMNFSGRGYGENPKYIAEKIREINKKRVQSERLHLVWAVIDKNDYNGLPEDFDIVEIGTEEYYRKLTSAGVWIDNVRKGADVRKREGQIYIQTWHGAAPIKKVEKDVQDKLPEYYIANAKRDSQMADLFVSGSEFYTQLYRNSFWYEGEIIKAGLPRQDVFWKPEQAKKKVYEYYNISYDKKIVLYAPTFRSDYRSDVYDLDVDKLISVLKRKFDEDYLCMVSKHPGNMQNKYNLSNAGNVLYVEEYPDFEEILAATSVLVTDYSGCMYDFSFTGNPVFLYQKDLEQYKQDRDFYIPMEELPYIQATTNQELEERILTFNKETYDEHLRIFMKKMQNYDKGNAAELVADRILEMIR